MRNIGELLRLKRLEKKYTLEATAKLVGVSINYISELEKGNRSNPSDEVIVNLAKVLDLDEDDLFHSFGKIPLSTRNALQKHPALSKLIAQISDDKALSEESQATLIERTIYWYKKLSEEENK